MVLCLLDKLPFGHFRMSAQEMAAKILESPHEDLGKAGLISADLQAVLGRALQKDPAKRFASASEMEEAVRLACLWRGILR